MHILKEKHRGPSGSAGAQSDFLEECWAFALRSPSGAHGSAGTQTEPNIDCDPCAPARSETPWERASAGESGTSGLRSRAPEDSATEIIEIASTVNWERIASHTLASVDDDEARTQLRQIFEDELEAQLSRGVERWRAARAAYMTMGSTLVSLCDEFELRNEDDLWNGDAPE